MKLNPSTLILRGVFSIIFGILALAWPVPGFYTITLMFAVYAFISGTLSVATGVRRGQRHESWAIPVLEGCLGIAAGAITVLWPGITLFALSVLVGVWALMSGVLELAFSLARQPFFFASKASQGGRILLGLAGVFSIALAVAIFIFPAIGAITLLTLVASYALIFGTLFVGLGVRLQRDERKIKQEPFLRAA
jgi:uncharacterized membrane protein HdeD (DUF308 family)